MCTVYLSTLIKSLKYGKDGLITAIKAYRISTDSTGMAKFIILHWHPLLAARRRQKMVHEDK